jgi:glycosyltransferase involved in cell wall biosynthesis
MRYYRNTPIDLFMLTSRSEGVPVSIMEALSFGIPVFATAVGGVPEMVSDEVGCLLPMNPTVEEIAQKLLDFIALSPSERTVKRTAARSAWETNWDADVNYRKFSYLCT